MAGNGVIGFAMQNDTPVIHMLNIKSISDRVGKGKAQLEGIGTNLLATRLAVPLLRALDRQKRLPDKPYHLYEFTTTTARRRTSRSPDAGAYPSGDTSTSTKRWPRISPIAPSRTRCPGASSSCA